MSRFYRPTTRVKNSEFRSGLEIDNAKLLDDAGLPYDYEKHKITWELRKVKTYTPDFVLSNGIIIETKGYFSSDDRVKHLEIQKQFPELDIRFVFSKSWTKLSKSSKTTYASWCDKHGFKHAHREIPQAWIDEEPVGFNVVEFMNETKQVVKRLK